MLDEKFKARMKKLLGNGYEDFIYALENKDAVRGIRVNTLKTDSDFFSENERFSLTPLSYCRDGFMLNESDGIGSTTNTA